MERTEAKPLRVVTFNAGLAIGVVPHAVERAPLVAAGVAAVEAELVFVQEVWLETHWAELCAAAAARLPHTFRAAPTAPPEPGACSPDEIAPLVACAQAHCRGKAGEELVRCVIHRCSSAAAHLSAPCLRCVASHPVGTLEEILAPCAGANAQAVPASARSGRAYAPEGLIAFGGSFGTGYLSSLPLLETDVLVFESTVTARAALYARLDPPGMGPLHVFGVHLSIGHGAEQRAQIEQLLAWVDEKAPPPAQAMIVGDLNTGPSVASSLYARFEAAGFSNPYARPGARGTYGSWLIDHVLLRGVRGQARGEVVLDEDVTVAVGGRKVRTSLSDHAGLRVEIDPR